MIGKNKAVKANGIHEVDKNVVDTALTLLDALRYFSYLNAKATVFAAVFAKTGNIDESMAIAKSVTEALKTQDVIPPPDQKIQ